MGLTRPGRRAALSHLSMSASEGAASDSKGKAPSGRRLKAFVSWFSAPEGSEGLALLRRLVPKMEFVAGNADEAPDDTDVYISRRTTEAAVRRLKQLQLIVFPYAGVRTEYRGFLRSMGVSMGVTVGNLHHNASSTAEMAMALLLNAAKNVSFVERKFRLCNWEGSAHQTKPNGDINPAPQVQLRGKQMLLIGFGNIGKHVAAAAQGLGMRVTALRNRLGENETVMVNGVTTRSVQWLKQELPKSNVLVVACPATEKTKGMIGAAEIALLPKKSILVNVGRGVIVDEKALYDALYKKELFAAGIDTWYNYPKDYKDSFNCPPSRFPFHKLENVVMSPHRGGNSGSAIDKGIELQRLEAVAEGLRAVSEGRGWPWIFDIDAGY